MSLYISAEKPFILEPPLEEQFAAEGQTTVLRCRVFGSPKPLVIWKKQDEQLTGGRFRVLDEGHLEILVRGFELQLLHSFISRSHK